MRRNKNETILRVLMLVMVMNKNENSKSLRIRINKIFDSLRFLLLPKSMHGVDIFKLIIIY